MLLLLVIMLLIMFFWLVVMPSIWNAAGKIFKVEGLTLKKSLRITLMLIPVGIAFQVFLLMLIYFNIYNVFVEFIASITGLVVIMYLLKKKLKTSMLKSAGLYLSVILFTVFLSILLKMFVIQAYKIPTGAMLETLQIGDHILVNKFIYNKSDPQKDDMIVFKYPVDGRDFIKRVVAVAGDKIEIKNKEVYINGTFVGKKPFIKIGERTIPDCGIKGNDFQQIWEKQLELQLNRFNINGSFSSPPCLRDHFGPVVVPEDALFVMGDNRDSSHDSRFWGFVPLENVKGKAFIIYWSWNKTANAVRWDRIGDPL